jgi:hypothetical protein
LPRLAPASHWRAVVDRWNMKRGSLLSPLLPLLLLDLRAGLLGTLV